MPDASAGVKTTIRAGSDRAWIGGITIAPFALRMKEIALNCAAMIELKTKIAVADSKGIAEAARILKDGGLVAFPTETVYGLGANALDVRALACSVDTFQGDELAASHRLARRRAPGI